VIIRVEKFGGISGIRTSAEMDAKDIPNRLVTKIREIIDNSESTSLRLKTIPRGAADHYNYKISIEDGESKRVLECSQYDILDDLKSLVKYIEKNSNREIN
jgi:hypothetical protein